MATSSLGIFSKHASPPIKDSFLATPFGRSAPGSHKAALWMMVVDVISLLAALIIALPLALDRWLWPGETLAHALLSSPTLYWQIGYMVWFSIVLLLVAHHYGLYGRTLTCSAWNEQRRAVQCCLTSGLLLCGAIFVTHNVSISRAAITYLICFTTIFFCLSRAGWRYLASRRYERGLDTRNVIVVGASSMGLAFWKEIQLHRYLGRVCLGFVEIPGNHKLTQIPRDHILGSVDQLSALARQHFVDEIIIADHCPASITFRLVEIARECKMEVLTGPGLCDGLAHERRPEYLGGFPVISIHRRDERLLASLIKRAVDVLFSGLILIILLPLLAAIALCISLDSPGPIFYASERIGKKGRVFRCFKFRTMVTGADQLKAALAAQNERKGILFKIKNDPRVTRVGRILRKYSLDELPQLLNVFRGEMSLVGPRPPLASEVREYELEHLRRLEVLPGLTGLWQVSARQDPSFEKYVELDIAYVENWSIWLDMKILMQTAEVVVRGTGS